MIEASFDRVERYFIDAPTRRTTCYLLNILPFVGDTQNVIADINLAAFPFSEYNALINIDIRLGRRLIANSGGAGKASQFSNGRCKSSHE